MRDKFINDNIHNVSKVFKYLTNSKRRLEDIYNDIWYMGVDEVWYYDNPIDTPYGMLALFHDDISKKLNYLREQKLKRIMK